MNKLPHSYAGLMAIVALIALSRPGKAADFTWTGGSGGDRWGVTTNWSPTGSPSSADTAVFANSATNFTVTTRAATGPGTTINVGNLLYGDDANSNSTILITGGATNLRLRGDITIAAGSTGTHSIVGQTALDKMDLGSTSAPLNRTFTNNSAQMFTIASEIVRSGTSGATQFNIGGAGSWTLSGPITGGSVSNTLKITKTGVGTLILSGSSTFSPQAGSGVEIQGGRLSVENTAGSATSTGGVLIGTSGTLAGNGAIAGATTVQGMLAPGTAGDASTTLRVENALTLTSSAQISMDVAGLAAGSFDKIEGVTSLSLDGVLSINMLTAVADGNSWDLLDFSSQTGNFSQVALTGLFTESLSRSGDLWSVTSGAYTWQFNEADGLLSVAVVPEPSSLLLLSLGLGVGFCLYRRKP